MNESQRREAIEKLLIGYTGTCTCDEAYTRRRLRDPNCTYCDVDVPELTDDLITMINKL